MTSDVRQPELRLSVPESSDSVAPPDFIEKSLKPYSIGEKLRTLRLRKKLGLVELGKHTGLDRQRFPERPGTADVSYYFEALDFPASSRKLNSYHADFQAIAKEKLKPHTHPGVELLYLLSGSLVITIGSEPQRLLAGDSTYFDSSVPYTYWKSGDAPCSALIVTTP